MKKQRLLGFFLLVVCLTFGVKAFQKSQEEIRLQREHIEAVNHESLVNNLHQMISREFSESSNWPETLEYNNEIYNVEYSFDQALTEYIDRLLRRYRSDYSAIVVTDNNTGKVLAASGFQRAGNVYQRHLAFSSTHPAASLIKIVTAAKLLGDSELTPATRFSFRGRGTTLYRSQIESNSSRHLREQTLERAFAYSNNVIFGRAAIAHSDPDQFFSLAGKFGFNTKIMNDFDLSESIIYRPDSDYNFAELASGFNRETMISPVHATMLASIVANKGLRRLPRMISRISNAQTNETVWISQAQEEHMVLSAEVSEDLRRLMVATTQFGTARGAFRALPRKLRGKLEVGGKTGSITGGVPMGRRDWFVAYAMPVDSLAGDSGISVAIMNVNIDKWHVKSTSLAKDIISHFYTNIKPIDEVKVASREMISQKI
jgi:penicillin-binding protein A